MIDLIARYKQNGPPASGGFGRVYKCKDANLDREVAVKFIKNPIDKALLEKELLSLLKIRSKNVVQVYDAIPVDGDGLAIVEEFISGDDLIKNQFALVSTENYLKTIWQIAAGIADIHRAGLIHRDIKPNNMKMDSEGIVKIFDFGLTKEDTGDAKTKGFKGTFGFAAPELFGTATVALSQAIDTYAFGATALFLATQKLPKCMTDCPPTPVFDSGFSRSAVSIPPVLVAKLEACLAFKPEDRPSMKSVRDTIENYLLKDKHQALAVYQGKPNYISSENRITGLEWTGVANIEIKYDGFKFIISKADGEVYINNSPVTVGEIVPGSCVIVLGGPERKNNRAYITFDISKPEVLV